MRFRIFSLFVLWAWSLEARENCRPKVASAARMERDEEAHFFAEIESLEELILQKYQSKRLGVPVRVNFAHWYSLEGKKLKETDPSIKLWIQRRSEFLQSHIALAHHLAYGLAPSQSAIEQDLLSQAFLGLMEAYDRFDFRAARFSTYARRLIRQRILIELQRKPPSSLSSETEPYVLQEFSQEERELSVRAGRIALAYLNDTTSNAEGKNFLMQNLGLNGKPVFLKDLAASSDGRSKNSVHKMIMNTKRALALHLIEELKILSADELEWARFRWGISVDHTPDAGGLARKLGTSLKDEADLRRRVLMKLKAHPTLERLIEF